VPFHSEGPLKRWLLSSEEMAPGSGVFIALHEFSGVEPAQRDYCRPHRHDHDEINVFHTTSHLEVEIDLDGETVVLEAPATVLIPAGVRHAANVRSGSGFMVAILLDGHYRATDGAVPRDGEADASRKSTGTSIPARVR
jgi:2-isopropylmalate synthase